MVDQEPSGGTGNGNHDVHRILRRILLRRIHQACHNNRAGEILGLPYLSPTNKALVIKGKPPKAFMGKPYEGTYGNYMAMLQKRLKAVEKIQAAWKKSSASDRAIGEKSIEPSSATTFITGRRQASGGTERDEPEQPESSQGQYES